MEQTPLKILAYLNTYKRYDTTLPMAMLSLINQTRKPDKIVFFDDNKDEDKIDPRTREHFNYLFKLMDEKHIPYEWVYAKQKGAHYSHEMANTMGFDAAWFIDDDNVPEANVLEELEKELVEGVGAVGGLILQPPVNPMPKGIEGTLKDVFDGQNLAWYKWEGKPKEVEHLYSGFLYRCGIVHHDLRLSSVVFRGETMFTHSLFLKGYKLIITPKAITWHFQSAGGIHSQQKEDNWKHDQGIFEDWLKFVKGGKKIYVLDSGLGDHYAFLQGHVIDKDALYAVCYPEAFEGTGATLISIAEAKKLIDTKDHNLYDWCERNDWKGSLVDAYKKFYENLY